jgi:hypothetical protein
MLRMEIRLCLEMRASPWKGLHDNGITLIPARGAPFYPESIKGSLPASAPFQPEPGEGSIPIQRILISCTLIHWYPDILLFASLEFENLDFDIV